MKLFYSAGACSLAPHILLNELEIPYTAEAVNLRTKEYASGNDYTKVNPKGSVPAIQLDNGQVLTEVAVLMQYLADQKPEKNLIPKAGTFERYRALEWMNYVATEMHKGFSPLWAADRIFPDSKETADHFRKTSTEALKKKFSYLNSHFEKNNFLMGANFSAMDAYLFTCVNWAHFLKMDLADYPALVGFMNRVGERPSTMKAMKAEGLVR
jgi:glutathione S-transferase